MIRDLLKQNRQQTFRSKGFYKNLVVNVFFGFLIIYFGVMFLMLGLMLDKLLEKAHPVLNPTAIVNGTMLYIISTALIVRFLFQQLNTINMPSYQILPIKRSRLIHFLLLKPLFSPANYFTLLIVVPFALRSVNGYYDGAATFRFIANIIVIIWFDSLFAAFLKRKFGTSFLKFIVVIATFAAFVLLEYLNIFSVFDVSRTVFDVVLHHAWGTALLLLLPACAFLLNKWFFNQNYYSEQFNKKITKNETFTSGWSIFNRFGVIGELMGLEIKLIWRHKRTKNIFYVSLLFLLYGLMFYSNAAYGPGSKFFAAMFLTGLLMLMYGQWIISWDSTHFDGLMTKSISVGAYLNANFYLMALFNVISFIVTTPYFAYGWDIVYLHLASFLFNMGFNTHFLLFFATYNTKRIDLSKGSAFNFQGTTFKNFLIVLPMMFIPMILVAVLSLAFDSSVALWTLTVIGILGIIFHKQLMDICVKQFKNRKYALAEGFREKE
jgi:hypothetical protein